MDLKLVKYPDTFLRQKSHVVMLPLSEKDRELIEDMCLLMYKENGVGLAAVQVGYLKRICVLDITPSRANPIVMINPIVKDKSEETLTRNEGCLSAPGKFADVKRHLRMKVNYWCKHEEEQEKTFYDLHAQVIQHELDHMDGKLCIDLSQKM
jgi:peptide deformylase